MGWLARAQSAHGAGRADPNWKRRRRGGIHPGEGRGSIELAEMAASRVHRLMDVARNRSAKETPG
jgi:hypothetical protein